MTGRRRRPQRQPAVARQHYCCCNQARHTLARTLSATTEQTKQCIHTSTTPLAINRQLGSGARRRAVCHQISCAVVRYQTNGRMLVTCVCAMNPAVSIWQEDRRLAGCASMATRVAGGSGHGARLPPEPSLQSSAPDTRSVCGHRRRNRPPVGASLWRTS